MQRFLNRNKRPREEGLGGFCQCPVCGKDVPVQTLNMHLDTVCLRAQLKDAPTQPMQPMQPMQPTQAQVPSKQPPTGPPARCVQGGATPGQTLSVQPSRYQPPQPTSTHNPPPFQPPSVNLTVASPPPMTTQPCHASVGAAPGQSSMQLSMHAAIQPPIHPPIHPPMQPPMQLPLQPPKPEPMQQTLRPHAQPPLPAPFQTLVPVPIQPPVQPQAQPSMPAPMQPRMQLPEVCCIGTSHGIAFPGTGPLSDSNGQALLCDPHDAHEAGPATSSAHGSCQGQPAAVQAGGMVACGTRQGATGPGAANQGGTGPGAAQQGGAQQGGGVVAGAGRTASKRRSLLDVLRWQPTPQPAEPSNTASHQHWQQQGQPQQQEQQQQQLQQQGPPHPQPTATFLAPSPPPHMRVTRHPHLRGEILLTDFITSEEEEALVTLCDAPGPPVWSPGQRNGPYRGKAWGAKVDLYARVVGPPVHAMPPLLTALAARMRAAVPELSNWRPNESNAIDYLRGEHELQAHVDDRQLATEVIATVSLLGRAVMTFQQDRVGNHTVRVALPPRCLQVLTRDARYNYTHAIKREDLLDARRVSITFRHSPIRS